MSNLTMVDLVSRTKPPGNATKTVKRWSFPDGKKPGSAEPKPAAKSSRMATLYSSMSRKR